MTGMRGLRAWCERDSDNVLAVCTYIVNNFDCDFEGENLQLFYSL